ncbi:pisatin demethylase [Acephala macrosclerotiorum]|nr:pisatin demethylase [Acephala macrosclerotiorum]
MHMDTAEACEIYGPLVRVGPNELITGDPDILRKILAIRSPYRRSDWYDSLRLDPTHNNILSERNDEKHNVLRAKMAAGYSGKENRHLERSIDNNIANLIKLIETKYLSTETDFKPVDFARKAQFFTLDAISDIAFGREFGYLANDKDMFSYIKTTEDTIPVMNLIGALPWLAQVLHSRVFKSLLPTDKDVHGLGKVMRIAKEAVGERFGPNKKEQRDMLGSFVRRGLTQREAESETLMQILAGSDTTASAIRATILHIITSPHVLNTLLAEISSAKISNPITDAEARKLPYLQAVTKEGLRIFPPVTGLMFKYVPSGGDTIAGYFVPENTKIGYCAFGLFLDKKLWGEDAKMFRPERWLRGSQEEIRRKEANLELVFGYGRWQCLGKSVAQVELNKVFVELLRNFELTIVNPQEPWESYSAGIFIQSDMWLRMTKREPKI